MRNIRIDTEMLRFLSYILIVILVLSLFGQTKYINEWSGLLYFTMFLSGIGITTFFLHTKVNSLKNIFLISYFGVIFCLMGLNVSNIIYKVSVNLIVSILILAVLLYQTAYPFLPEKGRQK